MNKSRKEKLKTKEHKSKRETQRFEIQTATDIVFATHGNWKAYQVAAMVANSARVRSISVWSAAAVPHIHIYTHPSQPPPAIMLAKIGGGRLRISKPHLDVVVLNLEFLDFFFEKSHDLGLFSKKGG